MAAPDLAVVNRRASYNRLEVAKWTAAWRLSQKEARDIAVSYVLNGLLILEKPVVWGNDGTPTYPKIGEKPKLELSNIGGVAFVPDSKAAAAWTKTGPMDLRTAVLAVRLGRYLAEFTKWKASEIYWGGMGVGRDPDDRHSKGYAIDFHGALTASGKFDVWADWGKQPVTLADGKSAKEWPVNAEPRYRLDVNTPAGEFFYDVYNFLAGEACDNGGNKQSSIGVRSFVLCPDTPDTTLRRGHQDHIHCEVDR